MRVPVVLLGACALAAGVVIAAHQLLDRPRRAPERSVEVVAPGDSPTARPRSDRDGVETAKLRREVAELRGQLQSQQMNSPPPPERPSDPAAARMKAAQVLREHNAGLERAFQSESSDPKWAPVAAAVVKDALLDDEVALGQALTVDCRSRLCRVEIPDDGTGRFSEVMPAFALKVAGTLPRISADYVDAPSGRTAILYLSRDVRLPAPSR